MQVHPVGAFDELFKKTRNRQDYNQVCEELDKVAIGETVSFPFGKNQNKLVKQQLARRGLKSTDYEIACGVVNKVSSVVIKKLAEFEWTPVKAAGGRPNKAEKSAA